MISYKKAKAPSGQQGAKAKGISNNYNNSERQNKYADKSFICFNCGQEHKIKCSNPKPSPKHYHRGCGGELTYLYDATLSTWDAVIEVPIWSCAICGPGVPGLVYEQMGSKERAEFLVGKIFELETRVKELEAERIGGGYLG